jgi:hypothetical protein
MKLLAITLDRGAAPGEQDNATRAMGALLQAHPGLRDLITAVNSDATLHPNVQASTRAFWHGVLVGVASCVVTLASLVIASLMPHGRGTA